MAYIPITTSTAANKAGTLQGGITQLRSAINTLVDLYGNMQTMENSAEIEQRCGLTSGNGTAVRDMIAGLKKLSEAATYQDAQALTDDEILRLGQLLRQVG
jgi:X-X-X-Leu-X-X-Gly heptad repeat protein